MKKRTATFCMLITCLLSVHSANAQPLLMPGSALTGSAGTLSINNNGASSRSFNSTAIDFFGASDCQNFILGLNEPAMAPGNTAPQLHAGEDYNISATAVYALAEALPEPQTPANVHSFAMVPQFDFLAVIAPAIACFNVTCSGDTCSGSTTVEVSLAP